MPVILELPWPPSSNTYWRRSGRIYFISAKGVAYRRLAISQCRDFKNAFSDTDRLRVDVFAFPPDRRRRDLDNIFKCLLDSLQHAGIYHDDNQIDYLTVRRMPDILGKVTVNIYEI